MPMSESLSDPQPLGSQMGSLLSAFTAQPPPPLSTVPSPSSSRKRSASLSFDDELSPGSGSRKKIKEGVDGDALATELALELQCGCCTELCYNPVVVQPCQHFFCGSCCFLWVKYGGTNCPACRGVSTIATPSRTIQSLINVLLRADPSRARLERDRAQADEIYVSGSTIRLPAPRVPSPEPIITSQSDEGYARPCPHCLSNNPFGWRCPIPIVDPSIDEENAFHLDDGVPEGHGYCGNCDNLHAIAAPSSSRCDFCLVSFCGISVEDRCLTLPLASQRPHGLYSIAELLETREIYDIFNANIIEVDRLLDYLRLEGLTPRDIYCHITQYISSQPEAFKPLIDHGIFESHTAGATRTVDPDPDAPRRKICRVCACEVFFWGVKDWWIRERTKIGPTNPAITSLRDCIDGEDCVRQCEQAHAREFNHIIPPPIINANPNASTSTSHIADGIANRREETGDVPTADNHPPPVPPVLTNSTIEAPTSRNTSQMELDLPISVPYPLLPLTLPEREFFRSIGLDVDPEDDREKEKRVEETMALEGGEIKATSTTRPRAVGSEFQEQVTLFQSASSSSLGRSIPTIPFQSSSGDDHTGQTSQARSIPLFLPPIRSRSPPSILASIATSSIPGTSTAVSLGSITGTSSSDHMDTDDIPKTSSPIFHNHYQPQPLPPREITNEQNETRGVAIERGTSPSL